MLRFGLIFLLAIGDGSLSGCWQGVSREVTATVLSVRGQVVSGLEGQNDFRLTGHGTKPGVGSLVRTSNDARLDLALLPGVLVQVSSNSEIKIEELKISKDGNETADPMRNRVARIRLNRGKITVLFVRGGQTPSRFTISTQQAMIAADSDCLFRIQTNETKTRLTCVKGIVYASQADRPKAAIDAGYFQEWPSSRSTPISGADDAPAQIETMDALEAGSQLEELEPASHNRRPF